MDKVINILFGFGVKLFLLLAMALFILAGCKSTRTITNASIKADSSVNNDITVKLATEQKDALKSTVTDRSVLAENETEVTTEKIQYVPYDSCGNIITIERTITRTRNRNQANNVVSQTTQNTVVKRDSSIVDKTKSTSDYKSDVDTTVKTKISTPGVVNWAVLILVAAGIILVILILKKYKVL